MDDKLYNDIKNWLDGGLDPEEERELIEAIYSGNDEKIRQLIAVFDWNHLGVCY